MTNKETKILTEEELPQFAKSFSTKLQPGEWIFLNGDMGAGKTAFAREISRALGVQNFLTSPTFSILHEELLSQPFQQITKLCHLDLYRLKSGKELCFIGLEEAFHKKNTVCLFEWPCVMEEDDWQFFFQTTGCARPTRIWHIHIENEGNARKYEIYAE